MCKKILIVILSIFLLGIIIFILIPKQNKIKWEIEDNTGGTCTQQIYLIYEDSKYEYNVPNPCYANSVLVVYEDGKKETIKEALNNKKVTPDELIKKGVKIYKTKK